MGSSSPQPIRRFVPLLRLLCALLREQKYFLCFCIRFHGREKYGFSMVISGEGERQYINECYARSRSVTSRPSLNISAASPD